MIDVAVNGECSKLSPIFVACFSPKIQALIQAPAIYLPYGFCTNKDSYCSNFLVLYFQVYVSQEAETLAVHSLFTIQNTEAIKRNLRMCENGGFSLSGSQFIYSLFQRRYSVLPFYTVFQGCFLRDFISNMQLMSMCICFHYDAALSPHICSP